MPRMNGDQVQMLTDITQKLWQLDAEMLNVVPGEELGGTTLLGVLDASEMPAAKQMLNASFTFHLFFFFVKANILFRFLLVGKNKYECSSFIEVKWHKSNLQKSEGHLYMSLANSGTMSAIIPLTTFSLSYLSPLLLSL